MIVLSLLVHVVLAADCDSYVCPGGYVLKLNPFAILCSASTCTILECCDAYSCSTPVAAALAADYSRCRSAYGCKTGIACNDLSTGGVCDPGCADGYSKSSGVSFQVTCDGAGAYQDLSSTACVVNKCSLGPRSTTLGVDYSSCNQMSTGGVCSLSCGTGYTPSSTASPFTLTCGSFNGNGPGFYYTDQSSLVCAPNPCTVPFNPHPNTIYTACLLSTGSACSPQCTAGYTRSTSAAFPLICNADGTFSDSSSTQCTPSSCASGPLSASPNADYTACNAQRTGDTCSVACLAGCQGSTTPFTLTCANGQYQDASNTVCTPTPCSSVASAVPGVDYVPCSGKATGDICSPSCLAGFQKISGTSIVLQCTPEYIDTSNTVCARVGCMQGPKNPSTGVDYTGCNTLVTGDVCMLQCSAGYVASAASFTLLCDATGYTDESNLACEGDVCTGGASAPAGGVSYATCEQLRSGDTCVPTCLATHVRLAGAGFTLSCVGGVFADNSGIVCTKELDECSTVCAACPNGTSVCSAQGQLCSDPDYAQLGDWACSCAPPATGTPVVAGTAQCEYNECTAGNACAQVGQTCTDPSTSLSSLDDWYCSCVPPAQGFATASQATCTYQGECLQYASICTSRGQTCNDRNTTNTNDWECRCVAPLTGTAGLRSPATCFIDECVGTSACSSAGQQCYDPDTSANSRGDWQCLCVPPLSGSHTAAQAACTLNECEENQHVCASVGQTCFDRSTNPSNRGDWECVCVSAVGSAVGGPATCAYTGECVPYNTLCTNVGQACVDPSTSVGDWFCECVPPQVGPPGQQGPGSCVYDECELSEAALCEESGQLCTDPNTSPTSTGDWRCECKAPSAGVQQGGTATCAFDECTAFGSTCTAVGQTCADRDTGASSTGDWECMCPPPATGSATAQQARCVFEGECVPYASICTSKGQTCGDPSVAVGDWQCHCVPPQTGLSSTGSPAACILDECTVYDTCQQVGQVCEDANTSPSSTGDWRCLCPAPSTGISVVSAATCVLDECITKGHAVCNSQGQVCKDPNTSPESLNDWLCSCVHPAVGVATVGIATCTEAGECVPYSSICTSKGQACVDPSSATDDWQCVCVPPSVGSSQAGGPATCVLDECLMGTRCPDGQTCFDPQPTPISTADWGCECDMPSSGRAAGGAASCVLDECTTNGDVCMNAGQVCEDPNASARSLGDWMCICPLPANGTATAVPATCVFGGECAAYASLCTREGQTCVDPSSAFGDWECRCVSPQEGRAALKGPAACVYDECKIYASVCERSGQSCFDPNTPPSLTGDWECRCTAPTTGSAVATAASCVYDECRSANISNTCAAAGQVCHDSRVEVNRLNDWTCSCVAPATGSSVAGPAVCQYKGECIAHASACTDAGQTCYDPFPTTQDDWQCRCVPPASGVPATRAPALCELDECKSDCPTCAHGTCSDRGQVCNDPSKAYTSTGDWVCSCVAPSVGSTTGRAATCYRDECATNGHTCTAVGQLCVDPNKSDKSLDDWMCSCIAPATGEQLRGVATCAAKDECEVAQTVCTQVGQYCDDPSTGADNWMCKCPPPQQGNAVVKSITSCTLDECTATCPTCADTGAGNTCTLAGQACYDPDTSPQGTGNWRCICPSPLGNVTAEASPASCTIDECAAEGVACSQVGQICTDPDTSPGAVNDWICGCAPPAIGLAVAQKAVCEFSGECVPYSSTCTDVGQACTDPSSDVGDWTCGCVYPYTGAPAVASPTTCELDECTSTCPTCADSGSGNICTAAGQVCREGSTASDAVGDWQCVCLPPLEGFQESDVASCDFNECTTQQACSSVGQVCRDPNPSPEVIDDWVCDCPPPATGSAVGAAAVCQFSGECVPYSQQCTQVGQTCYDPSGVAGDWQCICVAPQVGEPGTAQPANCTKDECDGVTVCGAAGQDCVDPNPSPSRLGDWQCQCRAPSVGSSVGKAAKCGVDECATKGTVCTASNQMCVDINDLTLGDWRCTCPPPAQGEQVGAPAACVLDECTINSATCLSVGQECIDDNVAMSSIGDWKCQCVDGSNAVYGSPAVCAFNECQANQAVCMSASQVCRDIHNTTASLNNWQCECVAPYEGSAGVMQPAQCQLDECSMSGFVCTSAGQTCVDPDKGVMNNWACECSPPLSGQSTGMPATCVLDECATNTICAASLQLCVDPNPAVSSTGDWQCACRPPQVGSSVTGGAATCIEGIDECVANSPTCTSAGQVCRDPSRSAVGDWLCECAESLKGFRRQGVAVCVLDECIANKDVCLSAGQVCSDLDTNPSGVNNWSCKCANTAESQIGGKANCTHPSLVCQQCEAQGHACHADGAGGWRCVCPGVGTVPPCLLDECAVVCEGCADSGYGNLCGLVGQRCIDPSPTLGDSNDWYCECTTPYVGQEVGGQAACVVVDECTGNAVCSTAGQTCVDPSGAVGDWVCRCNPPFAGEQTGSPAVCTAVGCASCAAAGQMCEQLTGEQEFTCECVAPYEGSAVGQPAACSYDECKDSTVCTAAGQVCKDTDQTNNSTWSCMCHSGYSGERTGAPADCTLNCANLDNPCFKAGQVCSDNPAGSECECTGSGTGKSLGAAAVCSYVGVCEQHAGVCKAAGQACFVPDGSMEWGCVCVPPATGQIILGGPALCVINECQHYQPPCGVGEGCYDPDPSAGSTGDWVCRCVENCTTGAPTVAPQVVCGCGENQTCTAGGGTYQCACAVPYKGVVGTGKPAVCFYDECNDAADACGEGQSCVDPDQEEGSWECRCVPPLVGVTVGGPAECKAQDLCVGSPCGSGQACNTSGGSYVCSCVAPEEGENGVDAKAACAAPGEDEAWHEKWWIWVLIALLVLCCCVVMVWLLRSDRKEEDVQQTPPVPEAQEPLLENSKEGDVEVLEEVAPRKSFFDPPPPPSPPPSQPPSQPAYEEYPPLPVRPPPPDAFDHFPSEPVMNERPTVLHELHTLLGPEHGPRGERNPLVNPLQDV